ncbi:MAG: trypsin-like peptidase domain-containing protein [Chloroflexota bacterium]|nr:trypsin-like peptidase domain-containing protein [Chloroflexota bacterium]
MSTRPRLGFAGVLLVIIVSLLAGGAGGAAAALTFAKPKQAAVAAQPAQTTPASLGQPAARPLSWTDVAQRDGPAVVTIINQQAPQTDPFFNTTVPGSKDEGSGFIVDTKGDIVTNNHVVANSQGLTVVFSDGRQATAHLVSADQFHDLAVIKVNATVPAVLHFATAEPQPGEPVLAIGSALGEFRNSVTSGIVSALGRTINEPNGVTTLHDMIQTDAAINQGNSGGPLLNDLGEVIGVNTAVTRGSSQSDFFGLGGSGGSVVAEGLGFAIPASTVKNVAARLVLHKPPAFLGVTYQVVTQQASAFYKLPIGAYIEAVKAGSPAARAGLRMRDIILSVNGQAMNTPGALEQVITSHVPGNTVTLKVWRNGKTMTLHVKLGTNT